MFDGRWRARVDQGTTPLGAALSRIGVTADQLTLTGLVMAAGAAVAIGSGTVIDNTGKESRQCDNVLYWPDILNGRADR